MSFGETQQLQDVVTIIVLHFWYPIGQKIPAQYPFSATARAA
jgi:hypothetical protein